MREEDYLPLSGIQHFCFCRRQWALIHIEKQWADNSRTAEARVEHEHCHDDKFSEKRKNLLIIRGMRVISHQLKLAGCCDVVEFCSDPNGVEIQGRSGTWRVYPVEYKHGEPKKTNEDRLQLCAEAMALEEMLVCSIPSGALFYEKLRRREVVEFTPELREETKNMADEMFRYFDRNYTPKVKTGKQCRACSLNELCIPRLNRKMSVKEYIKNKLREESV